MLSIPRRSNDRFYNTILWGSGCSRFCAAVNCKLQKSNPASAGYPRKHMASVSQWLRTSSARLELMTSWLLDVKTWGQSKSSRWTMVVFAALQLGDELTKFTKIFCDPSGKIVFYPAWAEVRGDLIQGLRSILKKTTLDGNKLDGVIIETTGLADPAPVAQTFFADDVIQARMTLAPWLKGKKRIGSRTT